MVQFRYSRWDGTQRRVGPDADDLLEEIAEGLFEHGDLEQALRDLFQRSRQPGNGQQTPGLGQLLQRLQQMKSERLRRYDLDSLMDDLKERLDQIVDTERAGAQRSVEDAQERLDDTDPAEADRLGSLMDVVQKRAQETLDMLDSLPPGVAGAARRLSEHDFIDEDARQQFDELMALLQQKMVENVAKQAAETLRGMTPEQQQELRDMLRALRGMVQDRMRGKEPDFQQFMARFGHFFGDDPPGSLDELLDRMQQQMAQMQSLMGSMSPEMRQELSDLLSSSLDDETLNEMAQLAGMMQRLRPPGELAESYPFMGEESLTLDGALRLMGELQQMDQTDQALREASLTGDTRGIDPEQIQQLLGDDARDAIEKMREIARLLEEHGYVRLKDDRWELTPRSIRKLGEKALQEVFNRLGKGRMGGHRVRFAGGGGEATGETKRYEPEDAFDINLHRSLVNTVSRQGPSVPLKLEVEDFELDRYEYTSTAATVLLLDQSSSMVSQGRWGAAKKVAMALQALIQGQFPRDRLFLVGFSDYAADMSHKNLPSAQPNRMVQGTNMHHALTLARRLLTKEQAGTRQIIMVTDGEPTAHIEHGYSYFQYPPSRQTLVETLKEVKRCTASGIVINTFMLVQTSYLRAFVDFLMRINRGRAFYTSPERLGDYVLVDYLNNRRRRVT